MDGEITHMKSYQDWLFVGDNKGNVKALKVSDPQQSQKDFEISIGAPVTAMELYEDYLFVGDSKGDLLVVDAKKCEIHQHFNGIIKNTITAISFAAGSVFVGDAQGTIKSFSLNPYEFDKRVKPANRQYAAGQTPPQNSNLSQGPVPAPAPAPGRNNSREY